MYYHWAKLLGKISTLFNRFINFQAILGLKTVMLGKRFQNNGKLIVTHFKKIHLHCQKHRSEFKYF